MNIVSAAHYLNNGMKIKRPSWVNKYLFFVPTTFNEFSSIKQTTCPLDKDFNAHYRWNYELRMEDVLADDWEIVKE